MKTILTFIFAIFTFASLFSQGTQTIRGTVTDEASKAPIAGAIVAIPNGGQGTSLTTVTDSSGNFRISNVPLGRQSLKIAFAGYEELSLPDVMVTAGKEVILTLALTEKVLQLQDVVVNFDKSNDKASVNNPLATVSARSFNTDDTKRYAGALGDPSRMAANFAGVVSGNDSRNDIVVRGNSPNGMLWQLEGLNIPNPNHFGSLSGTGGPVSMLNNNTLAKSDFLTSAFPGQYGNAIAGVFDLKLRNGNDEKREQVAQVGFNGFELGAEGPFSKKSKASYLVNYRYSTLGLFKALGINFGTGNFVPNYQDLNFKVFIPSGNKGSFSLFGMGGLSDVAFLGNEVDTTKNNLYANENENMKAKFGTGILGASYGLQLSSKTFAKITLGASGTSQKYTNDSIAAFSRAEFPSEEARFYTKKYSAVANMNHKFNAKNSLYAGFTEDLSYLNLSDRIFKNGGKYELLRVNVPSEKALMSQVFAQYKHRFATNFFATAGLHLQHYTLGKAFALEPRLGVKYSFTPKQSLGLGYGLHSQAQNIYTYYLQTPVANGVVYTNKDLGFTRSHHSVITYENNLSAHALLKVEAYYQYVFKVPVERFPSSFSTLNTGATFDFSNKQDLVNKGTGTNYGLEVTLERSLSKGFYFLLTGSLFNSKYKGSDGVERNTAFNTHYVFNALAGKEFKTGSNSVVALNLKFSTVGGRYFSPLNVEASKMSMNPVYNEAQAYSLRQVPYLRADIKITYRHNFLHSTVEASLDLQNVTNHQNIFTQRYNTRTNQVVNQYQQSFFPVPFVRYTF